MRIEKILIDTSIYNGRYDAADIVIDVELQEGRHFAYNFTAKAHCDPEKISHATGKHKDACFQADIEKKFGNITAKIMLYEKKMMDELHK